MVAEFSAKTITPLTPYPAFPGKIVKWIKGTAAVNSDFFTVTGITTVQGCYLYSTTGPIVSTQTIATNVITVTNASNLTWEGFVWGI